MTWESTSDDRDATLSFEYALDAPPRTVWRALTDPQLMARWLPGTRLAGDNDDAEPRQSEDVVMHVVAFTPHYEISYGWRDGDAAVGDSVVTFRLLPDGADGTILRIIHAPRPFARNRAMRAANGNTPPLLRAA